MHWQVSPTFGSHQRFHLHQGTCVRDMEDQVNSDCIGTRCMIAWVVFLIPYIYCIWLALHWLSCRTDQWQCELDRARQPQVGKTRDLPSRSHFSPQTSFYKEYPLFARSTLTRCQHSHVRLVCFLFLWDAAVAVRPTSRPIGESRTPALLRTASHYVTILSTRLIIDHLIRDWK